MLQILGALLAIALTSGHAPGQDVEVKTASTHPMRYYVSLPKNWRAEKSWPVVVVIESANRDFKVNAEEFVKARGELPFIIVAPQVITDGGPHYREAPGYSYREKDWARVAQDGEWKFDDDGLAAVMSDVHRLYNGNSQYFITGWEAGTHTVFAMAFNHPERLCGAAVVCPNYAARHIAFAPAFKENARLPIRIFAGSQDPAWRPGQPLFDQTLRAQAEGRAHGFLFTSEIVKGEGHGPLPSAVLRWFQMLARS